MSKIFTFEDFTPEDIEHFGIKGQKWGIRRYQNPDGSLTPLGEQRYGKGSKGRSGKKAKDKSKGKGNQSGLKAVMHKWKSLDKKEKLQVVIETLGMATASGLVSAGLVKGLSYGFDKVDTHILNDRMRRYWQTYKFDDPYRPNEMDYVFSNGIKGIKARRYNK